MKKKQMLKRGGRNNTIAHAMKSLVWYRISVCKHLQFFGRNIAKANECFRSSEFIMKRILPEIICQRIPPTWISRFLG